MKIVILLPLVAFSLALASCSNTPSKPATPPVEYIHPTDLG